MSLTRRALALRLRRVESAVGASLTQSRRFIVSRSVISLASSASASVGGSDSNNNKDDNNNTTATTTSTTTNNNNNTSSSSSSKSSGQRITSYKRRRNALQPSGDDTSPASQHKKGAFVFAWGPAASSSASAASQGTTSAAGVDDSSSSPGVVVTWRARKDPWGVHQLRDAWSADAMTKLSRENMSERLHREYRYHPEERRRAHVRYAAMAVIPAIVLSACFSYYSLTGRAIWHADPQYILNMIRAADTSPRSVLYIDRPDVPATDRAVALPPHIARYRASHQRDRELSDLLFKLTNSAFASPADPQVRRLLEAYREQEAEAELARAGRGGGGGIDGDTSLASDASSSTSSSSSSVES